MNLTKPEVRRIKGFFIRTPRVLAEKAFLTFLGLFLVVLIGNGVLFYKYNVLVKKTDFKIAEQSVDFQEESHKAVLQTWQEREKRFLEVESNSYLNPFD